VPAVDPEGLEDGFVIKRAEKRIGEAERQHGRDRAAGTLEDPGVIGA